MSSIMMVIRQLKNDQKEKQKGDKKYVLYDLQSQAYIHFKITDGTHEIITEVFEDQSWPSKEMLYSAEDAIELANHFNGEVPKFRNEVVFILEAEVDKEGEVLIEGRGENEDEY